LKIVCIIQARMGSSRLPGKVMKNVNEQVLIDLLLNRLSYSVNLNQLVVATTTNKEDDHLVNYLSAKGVLVYRGSSENVLRRYYECATEVKADIVVRITGDCPLIDPQLVDEIISKFIANKVEYISNTISPTFPDGLDVEVFSFNALQYAFKNATTDYEREHVTPFLKNSKNITKINIKTLEDYSHFRWTVDERIDLDVISEILKLFNYPYTFTWREVIEHPDYNQIAQRNMHIKRNEGSALSNGQKLWKRAKHVIPGGNMLLSKRPEMFLPEHWPSYFSKANGCSVWDLDNNHYIDVSIMGIGTNLLGYGHPKVDEAVTKCIQNGNMSTLNCPEEVLLAERLVELHPWSEMVRFARTGGEANAIAVRIARAASGKSGVAICGYHGWHDWYLAANLNEKNGLNTHLLPGLEPNGVPEELSGSVQAFEYNDLPALRKLISTEHIGVVVMEVMRNHNPTDNFLEQVRDICTQNGIVLIFDECTSGFRENFGGLHLKFGVEPDLAMFGKALGNGYAVTAVIGRREVMEYAQGSFISSTFWTERIGSVAALATLNVMQDTESWNVVSKLGERIKENWDSIAKQNKIIIKQSGLRALASFNFDKDNLVRKTFFIQEMLDRNYLASNSFYASLAHSEDVLQGYFDAVDAVFGKISKFDNHDEILSQLRGPVCHKGFRRLN